MIRIIAAYCSGHTSAKENASETFAILLPIDFDVRIDKVVQWLAVLRRIQAQIAPHAELHAIYVVRSEEVVALLRMLPRLGDVDRNPSLAVDVEIGPAVIAGDLGGMLVGRQAGKPISKRAGMPCDRAIAMNRE